MKIKLMLSLVLAALTVGLFSGCSLVLNREYLSISPHLEQRVEVEEREDFLQVGSFEELREAILRLVEQGKTEGVIRAENSYPGDLNRDVPDAIYQVMKEEPLGAYAVEYIPYESPVRFLNYYEIQISVSYRVTQEELRAVEETDGYSDFMEKLRQAVWENSGKAVLQTAYFDDKLYDIPEMLLEIALEDPLKTVAVPVASVKTYPESGPYARVVEITLDYGRDALWLEGHKKELQSRAQELKGEFEDLEPLEAAAEIAGWLRAHVTSVTPQSQESGHSGLESNAYGALVEGRADSQGLAMAFKLLCTQAGVESQVVRGEYRESPRYWNVVRLDKVWYHLDLVSYLTQDAGILLKNDRTMEDDYTWNTALVPNAGGENLLPWPEPPAE